MITEVKELYLDDSFKELMLEAETPTTVVEEVIKPEPGKTAETEVIAQTEQTKVKANPAFLKMAAGTVVRLIDGANEWAFSVQADKKLAAKGKEIAGDGAMQKLSALIRQQLDSEKAKEPISYTPEEEALLNFYEKVEKFKKGCGYDEESKANIEACLLEMAKLRNISMSPENMFMLTILMNTADNIFKLRTL